MARARTPPLPPRPRSPHCWGCHGAPPPGAQTYYGMGWGVRRAAEMVAETGVRVAYEGEGLLLS